MEFATDLLDDIDEFLIMWANPGFAGQKIVPNSIEKIARSRAFLDRGGMHGAEIVVDGNVSIENAIRMKNAGNVFLFLAVRHCSQMLSLTRTLQNSEKKFLIHNFLRLFVKNQNVTVFAAAVRRRYVYNIRCF